MTRTFFSVAARAMMLLLASIAVNFAGTQAGTAAPVHAISMHGEPALPAGFSHFPYANADAPVGGSISHGVVGTFDSLNPFILKSMRNTARGMWDPQFGKFIFESLMTRSSDEPFALYGLLAEAVEMPEDRSWIEFTLNPLAKWSDGVPVTPEDVIFTYEILTEKGRPPFNSRMKRIEKIEKTGERKVKFTFNDQSDREFPLIIAGFTPVLPKHATNVATFDESTLEPMVGSGPYLIDKIEPGSRITFKRRKDYWGEKLPVNRGINNFDTVSIEYFKSAQAQFEAFKKGLFDVYMEGDPSAWQRAYDFPAVAEGKIRKETFVTRSPATMQGFVFNTRRPVFADRDVRQALAMVFDFEFVNRNLYFDVYKRTGSFWQGSSLSALGRPADERERALLAPFPDAVQPDVMNGTWTPPVSDGSGKDRKILRAAFNLLARAGYTRQGSRLVNARGEPLAFEILTRNQGEEKLAIAWKRSLELLGISVTLRTVDDSQYQQRLQGFEYDVIMGYYSASLSPGVEQTGRWGSSSRDLPGSFNYAGVADPAIDAMIEAMLNAHAQADFDAAVRALDRVLISGHYLVPLYHLNEQWVASWDHLAHPETTPLYGNQLTTWWDRRAGQ
ncbi:MAG: ABC transporter substrate-binding protein [Nitratireductor sp.]|nr:ABC transporter substrate-binding protein [Nitratireductor sp.]